MQTYSPVDYLKIDIANQFGHDKKTFPQRIAWVNSIKTGLLNKTDQAESPAQYRAACLALEDALQGRPTGHLVGLDACASGITILGILTGCHTTSANVGITGQKRMDMYGECTSAMVCTEEIEAERSDVKRAQMTHFYGSKATPKEVFGEDTEELYAFYDAQEQVAPGACYMMRELLGSWQPYALEHSHTLPDGFQSRVPVLDKYKAKIEIDELDHACITYIYEDNVGTEEGLAVAANATHGVDGFLVREVTRRCNYDREKLIEASTLIDACWNEPQEFPTHFMEQCANDHKFISLRGVEFMTEDDILGFSIEYRQELHHLIGNVLDNDPFPVICVHDEFKCHANNVNWMRATYQTILSELADSRVGEQIIQELRNDPTYVLEKFSTDLGDEIMKGEYFLS